MYENVLFHNVPFLFVGRSSTQQIRFPKFVQKLARISRSPAVSISLQVINLCNYVWIVLLFICRINIFTILLRFHHRVIIQLFTRQPFIPVSFPSVKVVDIKLRVTREMQLYCACASERRIFNNEMHFTMLIGAFVRNNRN